LPLAIRQVRFAHNAWQATSQAKNKTIAIGICNFIDDCSSFFSLGFFAKAKKALCQQAPFSLGFFPQEKGYSTIVRSPFCKKGKFCLIG
jgi:hypothetical protein